MEDARIPSSEQLMAEMGWVRQLARALVKDDALADDVTQDTWLVAAEQKPDTDRPLRQSGKRYRHRPVGRERRR